MKGYRAFSSPIYIRSSGSVVGKKEGEGPLKDSFDIINESTEFEEKTWEVAETRMQQISLSVALKKAKMPDSSIDFILAGDLLSQSMASSFAMRQFDAPFLGLYGACSTAVEGLCIGAMLLDSGLGSNCASIASSHFCSAERQFRTPLLYGGQRPPTAQWTVTGSGAFILSKQCGDIRINRLQIGRIRDYGISDSNNMGAAMAPAAYDTLNNFFMAANVKPDSYDKIITGDLGMTGSDILVDLFRKDGVDLSEVHNDCGLMIFDREKQDVHSGGSGCGCAASVTAGYLVNELKQKRMKKILVIATGALMSVTSFQQKETIPCVAHLIELEAV